MDFLALRDAIWSWADGGLLQAGPWTLVLFTLVMTHITIVTVTVYLHRSAAHRALDVHPALAHFFRFWNLADDRHGDPRVGGRAPQAPCSL